MKQRAYRLLGPITLFEWGAILSYFYFSGRLSAFLHPSFRPLVILTGALLVLSAVCVLVSDQDELGAGHECDTADCEHPRAKFTIGGILAFVILLLPIALAAKISPDSYGATLMRNRGIAESLNQPPGASAASPPKSQDLKGVTKSADNAKPKMVEVGDLLLAAQSPSSMQQWNGRKVALDGQWFSSDSNNFELVRMLILCCAADAQPLAVRIETDTKTGLSEMGWANVIGRVSFKKKGESDIPVVTAEQITPISQPAEPYVYHGGSRPVYHRATVKFQLPPR